MNPVRWWIMMAVKQVLYWRSPKPRPNRKPNSAPRCPKGHLTHRMKDGKMSEDHRCETG